ncbi:hypothetical protein [Neptuniibacter sp. QD37_11]|uniref:hypothetical protein n=1 Tax=Neptuniibacter sp. QD37_11 TaxID=3398209 RepID=UPI0039F532AB
MSKLEIDAIIEANPALQDPNFKAECQRWEMLQSVGEKLGMKPFSEELGLFTAYGMTSGKEGRLPDDLETRIERLNEN